MMKDLTVVIPAYNAEKTIGDTLKRLTLYSKDIEIIVVDDGSTDKTASIARQFAVKVISLPENIGYGGAIKNGIHMASHEYILLLDADGQHKNMQDIELLYNHIREYDMVVDARLKGYRGSISRRIGKWFLAGIASYLVEKRIPDLNSGFRIIKKSIAQKYSYILCNEFSFTSTLTMVMLAEGLRVGFIPIEVERPETKSSLKPIRHGFRTLIFILRTIMLFNPLKVFLPLSLLLFFFGAFRFAQGIITNTDHTITAIIGIVSAVVVFAFGLLADQISSLRKERA